MNRIAFHLTLRAGKEAEYREKHEAVPDALERAYLDSDAGLETYSVFEHDGHVFGFMAVDDPDTMKEVMETSEAQADWSIEMAPLLEENDDIWMDEVYRMI